MKMRPQMSAPEPILPSPETKRWSPGRKASLVAAARAGLITREEAQMRYMLSAEELAEWERALDQNGVPGLRTTRLQNYRGAQSQPVPGEPAPSPPDSAP